MNGFPILMYHGLSREPTSERYVLTDAHFRNQMLAIHGSGLVGVSLDHLFRQGDRAARAVALSFDDGHESNLRLALPILRELGFTATFFVTTGRIGSSAEWMSWEGLAQLRDAGMDVQAHGHNHQFLDDMPEDAQREELGKPYALLSERLGAGRRYFSFPGGRYTPYTLSTARQIGYVAVCSSEPGLNAIGDVAEGRVLRRYVIHQGTSEADFSACIRRDALYAGKQSGAYRIKRAAKRILGNTLYHWAWSRLFKHHG